MTLWIATVVGIGVLLALDIRQARRPHEVGFREALGWSLAYIAAAVAFGLGLLAVAGTGPATEFFTGYLVEKTLSIDNLFVFAVLLGQFAVPARYQQKVLLIGVLGALVLRGLFIAVGAAAVQRFAVTFLFFGVFLIYTAVKLLRSHGRPPDVGGSRAIRLLRRVVPVTDDPADGRLFTRVAGRRVATSLFLVVAAILAVDIVFALDSIPAIFGITDNAYLVFTTNAFALLGLRALYLLLVGLLDRLVHLHYGLAAILGLIGVKLSLHYLHTVWPALPQIPTMLSLAVILAVLATVTVTSLVRTRSGSAGEGDDGGAGVGHGDGHAVRGGGFEGATPPSPPLPRCGVPSRSIGATLGAEERTMRYALLIHYREPADGDLSEEVVAEAKAAFDAYGRALREAGVLLSADVLQPTAATTTVTRVDGTLRVQDGPFAETREALAGVFLVDVPDLDAAIGWAEKCPAAQWGAVEVRPSGTAFLDGAWTG